MGYEYERHVAAEAVLKACRLTETIRISDSAGKTMEKDDKSPVTVADFSAQAAISLELLKAFSDVPMVAEESLTNLRPDLKEKIFGYVTSAVPGLMHEQILAAIDRCDHGGGASGRYWVLDPVDGTKGFLRGEQYAIALALIEKGKVVLGVLGCPNLPFELKKQDGPKGRPVHFVAEPLQLSATSRASPLRAG